MFHIDYVKYSPFISLFKGKRNKEETIEETDPYFQNTQKQPL